MSALDLFFSAWSETDAATRKALISQAITDDATYSDPRSGARLTGLAAISDYVGMFSASAPGWTATVVASDVINDYARATVSFSGTGPDGTQVVQTGTYFADLSGDKIKALAGFVG